MLRIRIRIRIHRIQTFLGLLDPDPDPLVRGMDPEPDPLSVSKYSKKTWISTVLWLLFDFLSLKNVPKKGISGSIPKCHGSTTLVKRLYQLFYLFSLSNPRPRRMKLRDMMSRAVRSALANPDLDREAERFNRYVKSKTTFVLVLLHKSKIKLQVCSKNLSSLIIFSSICNTTFHQCWQGPEPEYL